MTYTRQDNCSGANPNHLSWYDYRQPSRNVGIPAIAGISPVFYGVCSDIYRPVGHCRSIGFLDP